MREIVKVVKNPKKRLLFVHSLAKGKNICESDDPEAEDPLPDAEADGVKGAAGVESNTQKGRHGGCGHRQPVCRKEGLKLFLVYTRQAEDDGESKGPKTQDKVALPASACLTILRKIPDDDITLMGLSMDEARPEWMILTVMPVPPPPVRPSVAIDGGATRGEDDLTYKLAEVIKANASLKRLEGEGAPAHVLNEFEALLQVCVGGCGEV